MAVGLARIGTCSTSHLDFLHAATGNRRKQNNPMHLTSLRFACDLSVVTHAQVVVVVAANLEGCHVKLTVTADFTFPAVSELKPNGTHLAATANEVVVTTRRSTLTLYARFTRFHRR
jgi:hypothetical protein